MGWICGQQCIGRAAASDRHETGKDEHGERTGHALVWKSGGAVLAGIELTAAALFCCLAKESLGCLSEDTRRSSGMAAAGREQ